MMRVAKPLLLGIMACILVCGIAGAKVSISPVIIEAMDVEAGDAFEVLCQNWGEVEIAMDLSLALFDQDESGSVFFLEDPETLIEVNEFLNIEVERLSLEPNGSDVIRVELLQDDFDHLYAVLFIKPRQVGIQTRFAVLFLLSTVGSETMDMTVSAWIQQKESLTLTVQNKGKRHGPWEGELHFFDASDELIEKRQVASGLVLAGRSRGVEVSLPHWVERIELPAARLEMGR